MCALTEVFGHRLGDDLLVGHGAGIGTDDQHVLAQLLVGAFYRFGAAAGDGDAGALGQELTRGLQANAAGAAGDQGTFSLQAIHGDAPGGFRVVWRDCHGTNCMIYLC